MAEEKRMEKSAALAELTEKNEKKAMRGVLENNGILLNTFLKTTYALCNDMCACVRGCEWRPCVRPFTMLARSGRWKKKNKLYSISLPEWVPHTATACVLAKKRRKKKMKIAFSRTDVYSVVHLQA